MEHIMHTSALAQPDPLSILRSSSSMNYLVPPPTKSGIGHLILFQVRDTSNDESSQSAKHSDKPKNNRHLILSVRGTLLGSSSAVGRASRSNGCSMACLKNRCCSGGHGLISRRVSMSGSRSSDGGCRGRRRHNYSAKSPSLRYSRWLCCLNFHCCLRVCIEGLVSAWFIDDCRHTRLTVSAD